MNDLKEHLIDRIETIVKNKMYLLDNPSMIYLERKIGDIDRINVFPYGIDNFPISWWSIDGKSLLSLKAILDQNDFYAYKMIDGKRMKIKLK
jgi:hypothetical protein